MDMTAEPSTTLTAPPEQPCPPSPSGSKKRAFQEVDDSVTNIEIIQSPSHVGGQEHYPLRGYANPSTGKLEIPTSSIVTMSETSMTPDNIPTTPANAIDETIHTDSLLATNLVASALPSTPQSSIQESPMTTAKKRRLSPVNKKTKHLEKEEKDRLKLEEKARKEEEKRKREEKRQVREEERIAKEEEKRKKEEEKTKKERSQMKLNAFFKKPPITSVNKTLAGGDASPTVLQNGPGRSISDYHREFPDFFLHSYTKISPMHRFRRDSDALEHVHSKLDDLLKPSGEDAPQSVPFWPSELFCIIPYKRLRGSGVIPMKEIISKFQRSYNTVDLTDEGSARPAEPDSKELLKKVPMKVLHFEEDVRPPYRGTFTKTLSITSALKLSRNPFYRILPDTNYDYDSEAEWEEPEEGEDLGSEEEKETDDDGDDDLEGFLDDGDDNQAEGMRRLIVGDLAPVCSGIRWQEGEADPELQVYKMDIILETAKYPIKPFSTIYWNRPKGIGPTCATAALPPAGTLSSHPIHYAQPPSAFPLSADDINTFSLLPLVATSHPGPDSDAAQSVVLGALGKGKRTFPADQLLEFKQMVEGSNLTKTGLVEVLKKRFPRISKDILKDTLTTIAARVGQREADKKWVCK